MEKRVRCLECGKECDGREAGEHMIETGHNRWELLLRKYNGSHYKAKIKPDEIGK